MEEIGRMIPDSMQTPADESLLQKEHGQEVRRAISELPEQMRQCTELRFFGGYSYKKIATLLRIQENTVRVQIHHARERLRRRFREPETGENH